MNRNNKIEWKSSLIYYSPIYISRYKAIETVFENINEALHFCNNLFREGSYSPFNDP